MESLPKCFINANKDNTELLSKYNDILVSAVFCKTRAFNPDKLRFLALTEKFIVYYHVPLPSNVGLNQNQSQAHPRNYL